MPRFFHLIAAVIFLCCTVIVYPQTASSGAAPIVLSPQEAVDHAIINNLMLETARIGTDMQRRRAAHAWNQFLPNAIVSGTMTRSNQLNTASGLAPVPLGGGVYGVVPFSMDIPRWNVIGMFSASLDFSFALIESVRTSQLEYRAGVLTLEKAKLQIEQAVRKMYNQILLLEANAVLLNDSIDNAQRQAAIAQANFNAGLAPRLTLLQAQVAVENMRPAINDLSNNIKSLRGNFALLLGMPYDTEFELEPSLLEASFDTSFIPEDLAVFISRSASGKPDISELQANIRVLQSQRDALRLGHFTPFVRLGWDIGSMFDPMLDPLNNSWLDSNHWSSSGQVGGSFSLTVGMSLNGLFGFTREGQQRKDINSGIQIQYIQLSQMIQETELEIFNKINSLETIVTSAEVQQAAVELAQLTYNLTEQAYRAGLQDFQSVQNATLALEQARLQYLTLYFNFLNDLIDLEYAIGVPFGTLSNKENN